MRKRFLLAAIAAAGVFAAGCAGTAIFRKGAFAIDDWDTWTGWNDEYGANEMKGDGLYYYLAARQDDSRDEPSDGYAPGLILSRELSGLKWQADLEADFKIPPGQMKRFSYGIWVGGDAARPSVGSASASLKVLVQRQNGPRPADDSLTLFYLPGGKPFDLPKNLKVLRFERDANYFSVSYSMNRKQFIPVFRLDASAAADAPAQKFFIGGFAGGDPQGAYARFKSLKLNGSEILR
jgi:hypothetical protein